MSFEETQPAKAGGSRSDGPELSMAGLGAAISREAEADPDRAKYLEKYASYFIREDEQEIPDRPALLVWSHSKGALVPLGHLQDFTLLVGKAKSGKSFAQQAAISAALGGQGVLGRLYGALPADRPVVLLFDTEQSRKHLWRAVRRVAQELNVPFPLNLKALPLRCQTPEERIEAIELALRYECGVGMVVIDGIIDLTNDGLMDAREGQAIAAKVMGWAEMYDIHIMTVLHLNRADTPRGHIGTALVNKCEAVIEISRQEDSPYINWEPKETRNAPTEPFTFSIEEGRAVGSDQPTTAELKRERVEAKRGRPGATEAHLRGVFNQFAIAGITRVPASDAKAALCRAINSNAKDTRPADRHFTSAQKAGLIRHHIENGAHFYEWVGSEAPF